MRSTSGQSPANRTSWVRNGLLVVLLLSAALVAWLTWQRDASRDVAVDLATERAGGRRAAGMGGGWNRDHVQIALSGMVRAADGRAIPDAEVCAACASCESTEMPAAVCTRTGPSGAYALEARTVRSVIITATADGYDVGYAREGLPITVQREPQSGLDIVLHTGGAQLSGTVVDALGGPIPHARVMVERSDGWIRSMRETKTDDDGHFALQTTRGFQVVRAEVAGYAPRSKPVVAPARDVDVQLTPESVVRGRVVASGTAEPVEGVELGAHPEGFPARSAGSVSDHEGRFALSGLEPGRYRLSAASEQWRPTREVWVDVYLADVVKDVAVEVSPAVRVVGHVQQRDRDGLKPCPRGLVTLDPVMPTEWPSNLPEENMGTGVAAQVDADGHVRFRGVSAGRYEVMVRCPEHVLAEGPRQLEVVDHDMDVTWTVQPGLALTVNVVDALARPVPNAPIVLLSELEDRPGMPMITTLTSDERGQAVVRHELTPGKYSALPPEGVEGEPASVELRQGAAPAELTLKLAGNGSIDVVARDEAGKPVSGLYVTALAESPAASPSSPALLSASSTLALGGVHALETGGGHYRLGPLKPASYEVRVEDGINPSLHEREAKRVQVHPGDSLTLQVPIPRGGVVRGKVVNENGDPEDNAWVTATPEGEEPTPGARAQFVMDPPGRVLTNADGEFVLTGLRHGARYTLRVKQPYDNAAVLHGIAEGQTVRFVLPASGSIVGILTDPRGVPLPRVAVSAQHAETHSTRGTVSGPDGTFSIERIPAGHVRLNAGGPALGFALLELDLAPGQRLTGQVLSLAPFPMQAPPGIPPGEPPGAAPSMRSL